MTHKFAKGRHDETDDEDTDEDDGCRPTDGSADRSRTTEEEKK
jgi:hypothetical protein